MLTVTDLFCGAGGSSSGLEQIPGVQVRMAANHWALAVETHNTNLPHADHDCADVSQVDPRRYPSTDILWASPECTNHSQARGKRRQDTQQLDLFDEVLPDAAAQRSRATMWDVVRFAEHHRYRAVMVENVVDAFHWQPFQAWLMAMHSLRYEHRLVWLNSMHAHAAGAPAPQSRDRLYVVFWRVGDRAPDLDKWTRPSAWCPGCERVVKAVQVFKRPDRPAWGRYRAQYLYRCPTQRCHQVVEPVILPAAAAIDWTLPGERIGDRAKPLADKTRARIAAGLHRYARPIHLDAAGNTYDSADPRHPQHANPGGYMRTWPADSQPLRTLHTTASKGLAYPPLLVPVEGRDGKSATSTAEVMRTQTARNETGMVCPPFIVPLRANNTAKLLSDPFDTFAAAGNHHAMVMRNNGSRGAGGEMCTPVEDALRTLTTAGHQSLVSWTPDYLLMSYYGNGNTRPVSDPMATLTTTDRHALLGTHDAVDDCHFRMLEPHEVKLGMAFPASYVMLGNKRERVRQAGNAVTPPAARDLGAAVVEALLGELPA